MKRDVAGGRLNLDAGFAITDSRSQFVLAGGSFHSDWNRGVNVAGAGARIKPKAGGRRNLKGHLAGVGMKIPVI